MTQIMPGNPESGAKLRSTMTSPVREADIASDTLEEAAARLAARGDDLVRERSRLGLWRLLDASIGATRAALAHTTECESARGPLAHAASQPHLSGALRQLWGDHTHATRLANLLVATVRSLDDLGPADAQRLRRQAIACASLLERHAAKVRGLIYESVYQEIGGEA
jgi:hypothetical protein